MRDCVVLAALVLIGGCVGSPGFPPSNDGASSSTTGPTGSGTNSPTMTSTSGQTSGPTSGGTSADTASSSTTSPPDDPFVFVELDPEQYVQIDRAGFPAVQSLTNILGDKDSYNFGTPADDANFAFVPQYLESLEALHLGAPGMQTPDNTGLDDDLAALGLPPCVTPPLPMDTCDDQSVPFFMPDVLEISATEPPAFPNGRRLEDPVMDIFLATILIDLTTFPITIFSDLDADGEQGPSLNPLENDVPFSGSFPYLAPAHTN